MKKTAIVLTLFVVLFIAYRATTAKKLPAQLSDIPNAWIDAPLNNSTLPFGEVEIVSHAASLGHIAQVELSVDGGVVRTDQNASDSETLNLVRQRWMPPAGGTYTVSVRAQNTAGEWSQPANITLTIQNAPSVAVITPTPAGPLTIVLVKNSFCRTGPGQVYRDVTAVPQGDSVEVRGVSDDKLWLMVYWPKFQVECWIVSSAAPPESDLSGVPALASPPTPTATGVPPTEKVIPPTTPPITPTAYKP